MERLEGFVEALARRLQLLLLYLGLALQVCQARRVPAGLHQQYLISRSQIIVPAGEDDESDGVVRERVGGLLQLQAKRLRRVDVDLEVRKRDSGEVSDKYP